MAEISRPAACNERMAASRPAPGPFTHTSTRLRPSESASLALPSAATWAANGVLLREPLKPALPAEAHAITLPSVSVMVTIVLLKDACTCATPTAGARRSFLRTFFFFSTAASATNSSSGTAHRTVRVSRLLLARRALHDLLAHRPRRLLGTLARARVGLGPLPAHRQAAAMPQAPVGADVHQTL